jgi:hypothetical protein
MKISILVWLFFWPRHDFLCSERYWKIHTNNKNSQVDQSISIMMWDWQTTTNITQTVSSSRINTNGVHPILSTTVKPFLKITSLDFNYDFCRPDQGYPPQSHQQQQFRNPHQFYPAEQQQEQAPLPHAERPPPAPLDSLQMLVKENGAVNGGGSDKRPRHSDEAAGDSEGRKRRRKSDRPTRISNEAAVKADEPLPAAEPPPAAAEEADKPAASSTVEEVAAASDGLTAEPEAPNAASLPTEGAVYDFALLCTQNNNCSWETI